MKETNILYNSGIYTNIESYIYNVVNMFINKPSKNYTNTYNIKYEKLSEYLWDILVSHDFCHLSKTQVLRYKDPIIKIINNTIHIRTPIKMYLDLGPGYHAAIESSGKRHLSFDVGLGELLVLYQMKKFMDKVAEIYIPGAEFYIIIDNLCGHIVNSIKLQDTQSYCKKFNKLINELNMQTNITLLIESEHFTVDDYNLKTVPDRLANFTKLSDEELENVRRFVGYDCSMEEAVRRSLVYKNIGWVTDDLFSKYFNDGIHMTQRASPTTICFRAFSGGDSRIQAGQVALGLSKKNKIYPFLLTSKNINNYNCDLLSYPEILPKVIEKIVFAKKKYNDHVN